jgi:hypothetical protein
MSNAPNDYFDQFDLNQPAATGGPVNTPLDRRAMHYFGFLSQGQQIVLLDPLPVGNTVQYSWQYVRISGIGAPPPLPQPDGAMQFAGPAPFGRYENSHDRAHVLVWLDGPALPAGQTCRVQISAWSKS